MNLFHALNSRERANLRRKLDSASIRFLAEYDLLKDAPPAVLATYHAIPSDWLMCCVETGRAMIELDEAGIPSDWLMCCMETGRAMIELDEVGSRG